MSENLKAFIDGDESREAIQAARDYLKQLFERLSAGGRKSKRRPVLNTPEAIANRERVQKHRAKAKELTTENK